MAQLLSEKEAATVWGRIDRAWRYTEEEVHPNLKRACELYGGQHWPNQKQKSRTARIVCNILFPAVETQVANLAFNYPDFVLKPLNREGASHGDTARHVIAYDWRQAEAQEEMRRSLRDKAIYGLGVTYDFWLWETEPIAGKPGVCVEGGRPAEAMEPADTTPDQPTPEPVMDGEALLVRTDRPAARRISPFRFFVSPEADARLKEADYCGFVEYRPVEDVKRDRRFKNTKNLVGSSKALKPWMDEKSRAKEGLETPADCRRVMLYHYFERGRKLHAVYCDEHQKPLMVEPWRWDGDWYPFVIQRAPDEEDKFWPTPPLLRVEHQQQEINEARTQHSAWRRQAVPKFQLPNDTLDSTQQQAVSSGVAGTVVQDVKQPLLALPTPPLQREVAEAGQMALADLQYALGLNAYETATPPSKRMTAPEVEAMRLSGGSRAVSDRQAFELACSELARHFLAMEMQYSVRSRELPIFGRDEQPVEFRDYTREEIRGEYLVEVAVGSTTAPKADDVMTGLGVLFQALPSFVQSLQAAAAVGLDLRVVLPKLLRAALPDLRDLEQELLAQIAQAPMSMGMAPGQPVPPEMAGSPPMTGEVMPETGGGPAAPGSDEELLAALMGGAGG